MYPHPGTLEQEVVSKSLVTRGEMITFCTPQTSRVPPVASRGGVCFLVRTVYAELTSCVTHGKGREQLKFRWLTSGVCDECGYTIILTYVGAGENSLDDEIFILTTLCRNLRDGSATIFVNSVA